MAASTTRLSITCFRGYPATSYEKRSRSSKTSVELTLSLTTRQACFSPTGKSCNTCTRLARRCAKQEKPDDRVGPGRRVGRSAMQTDRYNSSVVVCTERALCSEVKANGHA